MNINEFYLFVQNLANKDQRGFISPEQFNSFIPEAQLTVARKYLNLYLEGLPSAADGKDSRDQLPKELVPLLKKIPLTPGPTGKYPVPADYWQWTSLDYVYQSRPTDIALLDSKKYNKRKGSRLLAPSAEYPIAILQGAAFETTPALAGFSLTYLRYPLKPKWDYVVDGNDEPSWLEGTSQNLELPADRHMEIALVFCQMVGVNISNETLIQFGLTKEQTIA